MNKNIVIALKFFGVIVLIALTGVMVYFLGIKKEEKIEKTKILEDIKKTSGIDLASINQLIKWNTKNGELTLDGQGYHYVNLLKASELMQLFDGFNKFFNDNQFKKDSLNPETSSADKILIRYKKSNIVCNLIRIDNADNNASSLNVGCADITDTMCNFNSNCGNECNVDSDCVVKFDSCQKKTLCRNKNYKFYNECSDSSNLIKDIDFKIQNCQCKNNQCEPYFPYLTPTPTSTP